MGNRVHIRVPLPAGVRSPQPGAGDIGAHLRVAINRALSSSWAPLDGAHVRYAGLGIHLLEPGEAFHLGFNVTPCARWNCFSPRSAPEAERAYCDGQTYIAERLAPAIESSGARTPATGSDCWDSRHRWSKGKAKAQEDGT